MLLFCVVLLMVCYCVLHEYLPLRHKVARGGLANGDGVSIPLVHLIYVFFAHPFSYPHTFTSLSPAIAVTQTRGH